MMRVLIVGAGAVGLPYGYHLQKGGAEVCFMVRPKQQAAVAAGVALKQLALWRRPVAAVFLPDAVYSDFQEWQDQEFDYILLAVPATSLTPEFVNPLAAAAKSATIIVLQSNPLEDNPVAARDVKHAEGVISLISFQAPLPGQPTQTEAIHYWLPPLAKALFVSNAVGPLVACLAAGGMPAAATDSAVDLSLSEAVMVPMICALETNDWSIKRLRCSASLGLALAAVSEAVAICAKKFQLRVPLVYRILCSTLVMRLVLMLAPRLTPFPLEIYLKYHFTKVGLQSRQFINTFVSEGKALGMPHDKLMAITAAL